MDTRDDDVGCQVTYSQIDEPTPYGGLVEALGKLAEEGYAEEYCQKVVPVAYLGGIVSVGYVLFLGQYPEDVGK